ncbi:ATP-dependent Clp protease ATP-binding subunit CLPT1, chloroplastic-like [Benincasa hispida]|uniref:ATP-dependent Clp protease ATP-binding subunit CLPT1, chloroplastic-like n=1 Tax=Benincasa hispida TaxID=102211 RepID=UPI0019016DAC|nr:ATP-dependent Clp protease ATP-binding subunit CLPT1, chloroplastic-like [Benincasa hispida]
MAASMNSLSLSQLPFSLPAQSNCYSSEHKALFLPPSPLIELKLAIKRSNPTHPASKFSRRATTATVSFSLPASKPEGVSPEKIPKWSARAIKSFTMAELEARKLKYPNTGTEALLMGILIEGTSNAAKFLRANGITLFKVREETVKLLGKSDMYFFSPEHPPLTEPAQRALDWAVAKKLKSGQSGEITTGHLLLGIWSEESAGRKILATLGFDDEKAKEIEKTVDKDATFSYK